MIIGAMIHCALLHFVCDWKAAQINVQFSLIQQLMLYKIKQGHKDMEATKNIYYAKGESAVVHIITTRW